MTVTTNAGDDGNACSVCGAPMPATHTRVDRWGYQVTERNTSMYCSKACKQKSYRERVKAGTVKPRAVRQREAAANRLEQVRRELTHATGQVSYWRQRVKDLQEQQRELDAVVNPAQVSLVTTLPAATVQAMQDACEPSWVFELGTVTDDELARRNGVSVRTVRRRRRQYGIGGGR